MSYSLGADSTSSGIDEQIAILESIPEFIEQDMLDIAAEYEAPIIADLGQIPGPVARPVEWTSARQMRAFFASDGFGKGIPTKRSGTPGMGFYVAAEREGDSVYLIIGNRWGKSKYIFGALQAEGFAAPQQQFHRNTGWKTVQPKVNRWFNIMNMELIRRYNARVSNSPFKG